MRKGYLYSMIVVIIIIAVVAGILLFQGSEKNNKVNTVQNSIENVVKQKEPENIVQTTNTISVNSEQEKVSPKAVLILKKEYTECGHTIKQYSKLPENLVNCTKEEIQEAYSDWEIEKFSPQEVILIKQEAGICREHYLLKEKDGKIAIYKIGENEEETLKEETEISTQYLTPTDLLKIQQGIKVYGEEGLNSALEDFE